MSATSTSAASQTPKTSYYSKKTVLYAVTPSFSSSCTTVCISSQRAHAWFTKKNLQLYSLN